MCNNEHLEHSSNKFFDLLNSDAFQTLRFTSRQPKSSTCWIQTLFKPGSLRLQINSSTCWIQTHFKPWGLRQDNQNLRLVEFRRISNPEVYVKTTKTFDLLNSDAFQTRKFTSGQINKLERFRVSSMIQHWIKPWEKGEPPSFSMHPNSITPLSA